MRILTLLPPRSYHPFIHLTFTALLLAPLSVLHAVELPPAQPYAWYREDGLKADGSVVTAWENVSSAISPQDRVLNRVVGKPQALRVQSASGPKTVVRINGESALWQAVGSWGTLSGQRTVVIYARVPTDKTGTLFDGSTRVGSTPVKWQDRKWNSSESSESSLNQGDWQVHTFIFNAESKPLGGFILGANVATRDGLKCDVGEVLIYPRQLNDMEMKDVTEYLQKKWGDPEELPPELQPQPPQYFRDSRVVRTIIRKQGDDGVHTYRIPGLATTNKGTLIAVFDMRHQNGGDLPANIDVGMMRSTDDGATWSPMNIIIDFDKEVPESRGNGVGDPAILVDRQTGTIFVAALWSKGNRAWNGSGPGMSPDETGQLVIVKSVDDGMTWSTPINITSQVKDPAWRLCFNGPGSGIQLRDGTLVFAAQFKGPDNVPHSCFIASEDHGNRWRISPPAVADSPPTSESSVVELANGSLLLSMRNESHAGVRVWSRWDWKDNLMQGKWSDKWLTVTDPTCMASLIRHPHGELIFSNPNNAQKRVALTIRTSTDDGQTWSVGRLLDPHGAMYSSLSILRDGQIGVLYESVDEAGLVFARFPLDWLLEGASVPNVPEARTETTGKFGWWPARHAAKVAETKANRGNASLRVMFFGDSITQGWENAGKEAWEQHFAKFTPANYGFGGDSTQHVLWRVLNGECDEIAPKAIVLLIGTNNVRHGDFTPEQIADGIGAILAALEKKCPKSKVLLLGILPRGSDKSDLLRQKVDAVNALLPTLADNRRVHYLNVNSKLLNADGTLSQSIAPDLLHLSAEGYGILAEQIETKLQELMANE